MFTQFGWSAGKIAWALPPAGGTSNGVNPCLSVFIRE